MANLTKKQRAERSAAAAIRAKAIELSGVSEADFDALSAEQRAALEEQAKASGPAVAADEGLIEVFKDGQTLEVHPTCVAAHQAAGWKVVE